MRTEARKAHLYWGKKSSTAVDMTSIVTSQWTKALLLPCQKLREISGKEWKSNGKIGLNGQRMRQMLVKKVRQRVEALAAS